MKISVIIPTFNEEKVIDECLISLSRQNYNDFEVIVVDDGSTDHTVEVVNSLNTDHRTLITLLHEKHQGPAMARNLGAKHAKGEILVFVDADMTFDSNFLQNLAKPIIEKKTFGTFSKEEYVSNWNNVWAKCWNINNNLPSQRRLPNDYPDHQKVFRAVLKKEFDRVGGFNKGGYTDDWTLSEKLGYEAQKATGARFYHKNPDNLWEIFDHAKWIGKREYKLEVIGVIFALLRSSLPVSKVVGLYKAIRYKTPQFFIYKIVYDFGIFCGIISYTLLRRGTK